MAARRRNYVIIFLLFIVLLMGVGYAAFSQVLNVTGSSTVSSTWNVRITNIALKSSTSQNPNPVGLGDSPATQANGTTPNPTYTDTLATFYSTLQAPGDSVTYVVTISNSGTVDAKVKTIQWVDDYDVADTTYDDSPIIYSYSFPDRNNVLVAGTGVTTVEVTVTYDPAVTSQPSSADLEKSASLSIIYEQAT